jgi:hypothetical protein
MNYRFFLIACLSLVLLLNGSDNCFTSHIKDPKTGVITTHSITKADCNCPCTANRAPDGTCRSCGHKVIEKKPF